MKYQTMGDALNQLFKNLGIEDQILENQAVPLWSEIAGENISNNTEAVRIKDGILFVKVKSAAWKNELLFYKPELIQKLNKSIGKKVVTDILWV